MPRISAAPRPPARGKSTTLARAGVLLYGQNYLIPLAKLIGVSTKTIRRWLDGGEIPSHAWEVVYGACVKRGSECRVFADDLWGFL